MKFGGAGSGDITVQVASVYYFLLKGEGTLSGVTAQSGRSGRGGFDEKKMKYSPPFFATKEANL